MSSSILLSTLPDHPRACGERLWCATALSANSGLSPRVRGTLKRTEQRTPKNRIIPARAGNARWRATPGCAAADHPRACGERQRGGDVKESGYGSSPRVRGTREDTMRTIPRVRIIPARAGNATSILTGTDLAPDHPRACGERASDPPGHIFDSGSSPRVRGTRARGPGRSVDARIIPARAGNAKSRHLPTRRDPDHPRACGERPASGSCSSSRGGSSPRVRGTLIDLNRKSLCSRIIPARAGNAAAWSCASCRTSDHPRACGERHAISPSFDAGPGSSPRVRRTRAPPGFDGRRRRIIPARAGNARSRRRSRRRIADHPRACGERARQNLLPTYDPGSSPRVRGTRDDVDLLAADCRIIPARAGNA